MSFDGSVQCWVPDVPISAESEWRLKIAKFGDGYEQRMLDGINALAVQWQLQWTTRFKDDLLAMDAFLTNEGASSFEFRDPASGLLYNVFCDAWNIEWSPARRRAGAWVYYGSMTATFRKANGVGIPGGGSPGGPMITVVQDTFTAANGTLLTAHVGETGAAWALASGAAPSPTIQSNRVRPTAGVGIWFASGQPPSPNYWIEAEIDFLSADPNDNVQLIGRLTNPDTYYMAGYAQASGGWFIIKSVAGTLTQLGVLYPDTFTAARVARLDMRGSTITLLVNSQPIIEATDVAISAAGLTGIRYGAGVGPAAGRHITSYEVVAL